MYKQSLFAISALALISTNVFANTDTKKLDEVVVTAKSDKKIEDLSSSVTVITAEDIAKLNATNIKDILVKQAGIITSGATSMTGGRESFSIRGLDHTYSLILVDGKKINPTEGYIGHSDFQYSWVPVNMIERIEIIKGPKSSIYGSQAIGGVINIITKKYAKKIYGEIDVQAGFSSAENGGDEQKYSANIGGNISDKLYMFLAVNKNKRDATGGDGFGYNSSYQQVAINDATYIEGVDSTDGLLKLKYNFDDTQSIYASYLKGKEERKEFDKSVSYKLDKDIYSFGYEKAFDSVAFSLDYSRSKIDSKVDSMFAKYTHGLTTDNIKGEAKISALKYNYIVVGTETLKDRYERTLPIGTNQYDFDNRANSYYIQDEVELGDFILSFGGRIDDNQKYGNDFSPNAGVVYKIDEQQRLKLNYGEGFKAPLLTQGSSGFYSTGIWGNDDLKAETSKSYELAYEFYGQDTIFKSSIFKTDLKNMIKSESGHGNNGKQSMYVNVDEASTRGFELGVEHNLTEEHILNANYTYVKTEDKKTEKALTYKPKNTFNIGLSSELGWGISSYLSANYIGTQYTDAANKTKAKGYTLFNAQISKEITKDLTARIGVDNITNEKFDDNEPYYLEQRFAYVGLNYKF